MKKGSLIKKIMIAVAIIIAAVLLLIGGFVVFIAVIETAFDNATDTVEAAVVQPPTEVEVEEETETETAEVETEQYEPKREPGRETTLDDLVGRSEFTFHGTKFTKHCLPDIYYPEIDYSYFQPTEDYRVIEDSSSPSYAVVRSINTYVDENGFLRYVQGDDAFKVNGEDDYVVALGTFYKDKGTCGNRYYVVTTSGAYTCIAGDEKSDLHTDPHHMFTYHGEQNQYAGMIEWLVDNDSLCWDIREQGTVTVGPVTAMQGDILALYSIE